MMAVNRGAVILGRARDSNKFPTERSVGEESMVHGRRPENEGDGLVGKLFLDMVTL